ncbi:MAG: flagellar basal body rod protein FlgB [Xanthobacteraceae bacterium]
MPIADIPILSMLRRRMEWHQEREQVLAENVANADTPGYRPRDLDPPNFQRELTASVALDRTNPEHLAGIGDDSRFAADRNLHYEVRPSGNAVNHEDEMMKVASNQMDFDAVADLYTRSLALIKLAAGAS